MPADTSSAVILVYHRIGEDSWPETNLTLGRFSAQMEELATEGYHVLPLKDIVQALGTGQPLPPRTVALSFDGGHRSIMDRAIPVLAAYRFPFTVFFASDIADRKTPDYLNWNDLRRIRRMRGGDLGMHPAAYTRLAREDPAGMIRHINNARARYRAELGEEPEWFAYPFGEISAAYRDVIAVQGFKAAFGQHSGVAYAGQDILALPRFVMTDHYGDMDRFRLIANALPLPVEDFQPEDPLIRTTLPAVGLTLDPFLSGQAHNVSCFVSGQGRPEHLVMGERRIELRLEKPLEQERTRINCTLKADDSSRRAGAGGGFGGRQDIWRWFGVLLTLDTGDTGDTGGVPAGEIQVSRDRKEAEGDSIPPPP